MAKEKLLCNKHEYVGEWWLPDFPDLKVIGVLKYDPERIFSLHLEGKLQGDKYNTIHGYASGNNITLLDSFSSSESRSLGPKVYTQSIVTVNQAIIGQHYNDEKEIYIKKIYIEFDEIKAWTRYTGISNNSFEEQDETGKFIFTYELPDDFIFFEDDNVKINLSAKVTLPSILPLPTDIVIKERNYFAIENKSKTSGLFYNFYSNALRKFISFASRSNMNYRAISYKGEDQQICSILFNLLPLNIQYPGKSLNVYDVLFFLDKIKTNTNEKFSHWLNFMRASPEVCDLYFYSNKGQLNDRFLSTVQALEEYHRDTNAGAAKKWGFKSRIKALFNSYGSVMTFRGDVEEFANIVADHRDYYSHWFDKKRDKVLHGLELDYLTRDVYLLLQMCLLSAFGFSVNEVTNLIKNNIYYSNYLEINSKSGMRKKDARRRQWINEEE